MCITRCAKKYSNAQCHWYKAYINIFVVFGVFFLRLLKNCDVFLLYKFEKKIKCFEHFLCFMLTYVNWSYNSGMFIGQVCSIQLHVREFRHINTEHTHFINAISLTINDTRHLLYIILLLTFSFEWAQFCWNRKNWEKKNLIEMCFFFVSFGLIQIWNNISYQKLLYNSIEFVCYLIPNLWC